MDTPNAVPELNEPNNVQPVVSQPRTELLSSTTLIKKAWNFYRTNFRRMWPLFLLGSLEGISYDYKSFGSYQPLRSIFQGMSWGLLWALIITGAAVAIILFLSKIALLKAVTDGHKGQFVGIKDSYTKSTPLFWSYILLNLLIFMVIIGGFSLLLVPGIILFGYLVFAFFEFFVEGKRGYAALLGSWTLVKGHWWSIVLKILALFVWIFLAMLAALAVSGAVGVAGSFVLYSSTVAGTILLVLAGIIFLGSIFLLYVPLGLLSVFELYYDIKDLKAHVPAEDMAVSAKRKNKLVVCLVVGILMTAFFAVADYILFAYLLPKFEASQTASQNDAIENGMVDASSTFSLPSYLATSSVAMLSNEIPADLQSSAYVNTVGKFQINLPYEWKLSRNDSAPSPMISSLALFSSADSKSSIAITQIDTSKLRQVLPNTSNASIAENLGQEASASMQEKFTSLGFAGFQFSGPTVDSLGVDNAYVYQGSAYVAGHPDQLYAFEILTIYQANYAYQILGLWSEAAYGAGGNTMQESFATFRPTL